MYITSDFIKPEIFNTPKSNIVKKQKNLEKIRGSNDKRSLPNSEERNKNINQGIFIA